MINKKFFALKALDVFYESIIPFQPRGTKIRNNRQEKKMRIIQRSITLKSKSYLTVIKLIPIMTKRLFRTNISTFVAESASDKAVATKKRKVGRLYGCFDRNTNFFFASSIRSLRRPSSRDYPWPTPGGMVPFQGRRTTDIRAVIIESSASLSFIPSVFLPFLFLSSFSFFSFFFSFFISPLLLQNLLCRYTMLLIDLD